MKRNHMVPQQKKGHVCNHVCDVWQELLCQKKSWKAHTIQTHSNGECPGCDFISQNRYELLNHVYNYISSVEIFSNWPKQFDLWKKLAFEMITPVFGTTAALHLICATTINMALTFMKKLSHNVNQIIIIIQKKCWLKKYHIKIPPKKNISWADLEKSMKIIQT